MTPTRTKCRVSFIINITFRKYLPKAISIIIAEAYAIGLAHNIVAINNTYRFNIHSNSLSVLLALKTRKPSNQIKEIKHHK